MQEVKLHFSDSYYEISLLTIHHFGLLHRCAKLKVTIKSILNTH